MQWLTEKGRLDVLTVAGRLGVAQETVRRDLRSLESDGRLQRVHGGAVPVEADLLPGLAPPAITEPNDRELANPTVGGASPQRHHLAGRRTLDAGLDLSHDQRPAHDPRPHGRRAHQFAGRRYRGGADTAAVGLQHRRCGSRRAREPKKATGPSRSWNACTSTSVSSARPASASDEAWLSPLLPPPPSHGPRWPAERYGDRPGRLLEPRSICLRPVRLDRSGRPGVDLRLCIAESRGVLSRAGHGSPGRRGSSTSRITPSR